MPDAVWDVLYRPDFTIVKAEDAEHFVVSAPAPDGKDSILSKAHDLHFFFAEAPQCREGFPKPDQLRVIFEKGSMASLMLQRMVQLRSDERLLVLWIRRLAAPMESGELLLPAAADG